MESKDDKKNSGQSSSEDKKSKDQSNEEKKSKESNAEDKKPSENPTENEEAKEADGHSVRQNYHLFHALSLLILETLVPSRAIFIIIPFFIKQLQINYRIKAWRPCKFSPNSKEYW